MKRLLLVALLLAAPVLSGCSPEQVAAWIRWNETDPAAATAWLDRPDVQALIHEDWDQDGVVEPEGLASADRGDSQQLSPEPAPPSNDSVWDRLAECESGGNWSINTGNGYYGGLQFLPSTWRANGGTGMPHQNSREEQIRVAENLRAQAGFSPWPGCKRKLGL